MMEDSAVFGLVERYRRERPEIDAILQLSENAEQYLLRADQLEQLERLALTGIANTNKGRYETPAITAPFLIEVASTGGEEYGTGM